MYYIQRRGNGQLETVDEAQSPREARRLAREYNISDHEGTYYTSTRPCRAWVDSKTNE